MITAADIFTCLLVCGFAGLLGNDTNINWCISMKLDVKVSRERKHSILVGMWIKMHF